MEEAVAALVGLFGIPLVNYLKGALGWEGKPIYTGLGYAVIAIAGTIVCHFIGDLLRLA